MREKAIYVAKALARRLLYGPSDLLRRRRSELPRPPRSLSFVGGGDFEETGREFLGHFVELGGLSPQDRVLDVGCGIGRMALPLTGYLQEGGSYAGFDVGREMVGWCQRNITRRWPAFEFSWAPVYNAKYNPFGNISASEFRFPYPDDSFDFAFATSLFTHLEWPETRHYLVEIARVLRPGGTCLLTFFLLTADSRREVEAGHAQLRFTHPIEGGMTTTPGLPEEAVAFDVDALLALLSEVGLRPREPFHPGSWANTPDATSLQDIVIADAG